MSWVSGVGGGRPLPPFPDDEIRAIHKRAGIHSFGAVVAGWLGFVATFIAAVAFDLDTGYLMVAMLSLFAGILLQRSYLLGIDRICLRRARRTPGIRYETVRFFQAMWGVVGNDRLEALVRVPGLSIGLFRILFGLVIVASIGVAVKVTLAMGLTVALGCLIWVAALWLLLSILLALA